jgi:hypothetical protein
MYSGLWPSGVLDSTQTVTYFSSWSAQSLELHDLSPRGEILEVDTWPNQAGDTCHVLTDISIFHRFKTH